jgi:hypothetical protein
MRNAFSNSSSNTRHARGKRAPLMLSFWLVCAMALAVSGCRSQPVAIQPQPPRLVPPPAELMQEEVPNLRQRLLSLSGQSLPMETGQSGN